MSRPTSAGEIRDWLAEHGWSPERDIGERADALITARIDDFRKQGQELAPLPAACSFLHSYGLLRLPISPTVTLILDPLGGYEEDAEDVVELAGDLGVSLFPVGYETYEGGILLIDESGRFFYLHDTGPYFLGNDAIEMFLNRMTGKTVDASRYYV
ncbi:SUKH-3 domain-containing protein [Streptomyces sp. DASNCL29]|uniref:SUKH-3 domain-containing protein n=1 Tax=Streptomyces sp. DASNCL29 TaxID=2583819 RepID=UPI00110F9E53|nr:SUKH-3 domain-containing protein [Streptomyces sp. DASNCL29]TMU90718.1 hypothetical protein FGK60_45285 [Streptomyces sp. DASNCL29]